MVNVFVNKDSENFLNSLKALDAAVKKRAEYSAQNPAVIVDLQPASWGRVGDNLYNSMARFARHAKVRASEKYYGVGKTEYTVEEALDRFLVSIPEGIAGDEYDQLPEVVELDSKTLELLDNLLSGNFLDPAITKKIAEIPEYSKDKLLRKIEYLKNYLSRYRDFEAELSSTQSDVMSANNPYFNTALSAVTTYRSTVDYILLKTAPVAFVLYVAAVMQELDPSVRELFYPRDSSYEPTDEIAKGNPAEIAIQIATITAMLLAISNKKVYPYFRQKVTSNAFELSKMENPIRIVLAAAAAAWTSGINSFAPYSAAIRSENPTLLSKFYQECNIPTRLLGGTLFAAHFWVLQNIYLATSLQAIKQGLNPKEYYSPFKHSNKPEMVRLRKALDNDQEQLDKLDAKFRKCLLANAPFSVILSNVARLIFNAVQFDRKNGSTDEAISLTGALMSIVPSLVMTFFALDGAVRASQTFALNGVTTQIKDLCKSPAFITNSAFLAVLFSSTLHKSETFSHPAFSPVALLSSFLYFVNTAEGGKFIPAVNNKVEALGKVSEQVVANQNRRLNLLKVLKESSPKPKSEVSPKPKSKVANQNKPSTSVGSAQLQRAARTIE